MVSVSRYTEHFIIFAKVSFLLLQYIAAKFDLGANLQIHTFLLNLESMRKCGPLPSTVFYQVDGGSENTAKAVIAICELIISKRICQKLVITRLVVGHTHEDIDGKFALIWKRVRDSHVLSPQQYASKCSLVCYK